MRSYLTECMQNEVSASFDGYEEYVKEATIANEGLTLSAKLSKVALEALAAVGNMFITWAFTKAIEFAIKKLDEWIVTAEEAREKLSDIKTELKSIDQQLKDNEELIKEALKEATYNGVSNLRYIDKIIYEWTKKGFKTVEDVINNRMKRDNKEKKEEFFFEYNWLDEN